MKKQKWRRQKKNIRFEKDKKKILGVKNKGQIEKGYDADLIIFDDNINIKKIITNGNIIK